MTLFEYLAAGYTLVLSFAVIRALGGIAHAVHPARRYWVHVVWLAVILFASLGTFWAFWSYREVEWTLIRFALLLAVPALQYVFCSLLVPPDPSSVTSWRDYFFDVRIPLFATGVLMTATVVVGSTVVLGVSLTHPVRLAQLTMMALFAIGLASDKPSVHSVLAAALSCIMVVVFLSVLGQPGALAPPAP